MITEIQISTKSLILTKIEYKDFQSLISKLKIPNNFDIPFSHTCLSLDEFFDDEFDLLTNELEPHNRKLITRFYNDAKCETIYWSLLEQYYGDNATGETYVYQPPKPKKFLGLF
jgi:hypothetical protein